MTMLSTIGKQQPDMDRRKRGDWAGGRNKAESDGRCEENREVSDRAVHEHLLVQDAIEYANWPDVASISTQRHD